MHAGDGDSLTGAEAVAASAVCLFASAIVAAYLEDWLIRTISPRPILLLSLATAGAMYVWLQRRAQWRRDEVVALVSIVAAVFALLMWLARPALLPVGRGPDLTHHLLLIDYIDRHWRFVHEPGVEPYLGEMVHYTPGSHVLASLAGAWAGSDGLHAVHSVVALSVALKAGLVFLVALRLLPRAGPRVPLALTSVLLLLLPRPYFLGSFAHDSFFSQVVSEMFAVSMWWALVAWEKRPGTDTIVLVALAGTAAFLTWPVFIGPPLLVLGALVLAREGLALKQRLGHLLLGAGPIAAVAAMYIAGRAGWILIVGTSGAVIRPTPSVIGWTFLLLAAAGLGLAAIERRSRATLLLLAAIGVQSFVLFAMAKANGADTPYMALKMAYLALYPLAPTATLPLAAAWQLAVGPTGATITRERLAWAAVALAGVALAGSLVVAPRQKPVVSESAYLAGQWARVHVQPACVDYLVADADTAYWLHLAVLGNPRMAVRTADPDTFDPQKAIVRWIVPRGLPFAITDDLSALPKDIRTHVDVLARFGQAAVVKRLGEPWCSEIPPREERQGGPGL